MIIFYLVRCTLQLVNGLLFDLINGLVSVTELKFGIHGVSHLHEQKLSNSKWLIINSNNWPQSSLSDRGSCPRQCWAPSPYCTRTPGKDHLFTKYLEGTYKYLEINRATRVVTSCLILSKSWLASSICPSSSADILWVISSSSVGLRWRMEQDL